MKIYKFRNCYLNTFERSVVKDGKRLELTPKTFEVLQLLVERAGEVVTKDEMLGKVWNGNFIEEGNLPVQISKLRSLLEETSSERFIETVQGSGYRFIAPAASVEKNKWNEYIVLDRRRDFESYRLYLKGTYFRDKGTNSAIYKAIEYLHNSVLLDPANIHTYAEIIYCYYSLYAFDYLSYSEVRTKIDPFLKIASQLDQEDDVLQTVLGIVNLYLYWNFPQRKIISAALWKSILQTFPHVVFSRGS